MKRNIKEFIKEINDVKTPLALCRKCKKELYHLDLIIPFDCECKKATNHKSSKMYHISELYNNLEFNLNSSNSENKNKKYILMSKQILEKIETLFFPSQLNLFNFSCKCEIEEEPYFMEECLEEFTKRVQGLKNDDLPNNTLEFIKALILDINIFVIILKKNLAFKINEINLLNVLYQSKINIKYEFIRIVKEYLRNKKIIENSFDDGLKYELNSRLVKFCLILPEKNLILLLLQNSRKKNDFELRIYDINNIKGDNYFCARNLIIVDSEKKYANKNKIKLYRINPEIILIDYIYYTSWIKHHFFSFIEIVYDENDKPMNIKLLNEEKYEEIKRGNDFFYDLDLLDDNVIIFTSRNDMAFIFKKDEENYFYLDKKIYIEPPDKFDEIINSGNFFRINCNNVFADRDNKQIMIYRDCDMIPNIYSSIYNNYVFIYFYDYDFNLKKIINFEEDSNGSMSESYFLTILNKECYLVSYYKKVFLISIKYLEIVTTYNLDFYEQTVFIPYNSNRIISFSDERNVTMCIYKFHRNEIKFVEKKQNINKNLVFGTNLNDKGDHLLITSTNLKFNFGGVKKISRIVFIRNINNKSNKNIKKDYSMFKTKKNVYRGNYINDDIYYYDDYENEHFCEDEECESWNCYWNNYYNVSGYYFISKKEDQHIKKEKYKNKSKRRYINFRKLKLKEKFRKYNSNKKNLNKYENEDLFEDFEDNSYFDDEDGYFD